MKYDYLTVIEKSHKSKENRWIYKCSCVCGNLVFRAMNRLKSKGISSCGCKRGEANKTHGMQHTKMYKAWSGMKSRCTNKNDKDYPFYSKRGICNRWLKFELFLVDMGEPPTAAHSIDRIDNDKGYKKNNCRWATSSQQQINKSTSLIWIAEGVEYKTLTEVANYYGKKNPVVHRWFKGYLSRGKRYPPKKGFTFRRVYEK